MTSKMARRVFVVGVGMHPFGNEGIPATDMGYAAGVGIVNYRWAQQQLSSKGARRSSA